MDSKTYEYDAFISYRHTEPDITIAEKLLTMLEKYRVPSGVSKKTGITRIRRIFRDREELPTTTDLSESIMHALKHSRFLIVICSPRTPASQWVKKEIEVFKELHGVEKIQALLIEGEPEEAFPEALRYTVSLETDEEGMAINRIKQLELLAADIRPDELKGPNRMAYGISEATDRELLLKSIKLLKTERLRCIAPMLKCKFDELYQRHFRQTLRNVIVGALCAIVLFASFAGYAVYMNRQLAEQRDIAVFQKQEVERQKLQVESERKRAEEQKELAQENERQAVEFSREAEHQSLIAKDNENKALANMQEAVYQKTLALFNEGMAKEQRDKVLVNQSLYLASQALQQLRNGDRMTALMLALEGLPKNSIKPERPIVEEIYTALAKCISDDNFCRAVLKNDETVYDISFSPDGKRVTASSSDKYSRIWNVESGEVEIELPCETRGINHTQLSPDGRRILTVSIDGTVIIFDAFNGKKLNVIKNEGYIDSVCFSADGEKILCGVSGKGIILWDASSGKKLAGLSGLKGMIENVGFSSDGLHALATSGYDNSVHILDITSGKERFVLTGHEGMLEVALFSPDGKRVLTASFDKTARIWDMETGRTLRVLNEDDYVTAACFSPDGKRVITATEGGRAKVWDSESGALLLNRSVHSEGVKSIQFSPDGEKVLTASRDHTARIWDADTGELHEWLNGHTDSVLCARFNHDGSLVATASSDNTVRIWEVSSTSPAPKLDTATTKISSAWFGRRAAKLVAIATSDLTNIYNAGNYNKAYVWDVYNERIKAWLIGHEGQITDAKFSPDGQKVVTASKDKTIRVWNSESGEEQLLLKGHTDGVRRVEFSPDGKRILSESSDRTTRIWDAEKGNELFQMKSFDLQEMSKFGPDSKKVLTVSYNNSAQIWDAETGKLLKELLGHKDTVYKALFSQDGKKLLTISRDKTARIWDAETGKELLDLEGVKDTINDVKLSPDGRYIAMLEDGDTIRIWDSKSGKETRKMNLINEWLNTIEFSNDGKLLMARDATNAYIYDIENEEYSIRLGNSHNCSTYAHFGTQSHDLLTVYNKFYVKTINLERDNLLRASHEILKGRELTAKERKEFFIE